MAIKRITTNLIKDSDIATVDIANNAITAAKITDGNITTAKLADLSVTAGKLAGTLDLTGKTITVATATTGDNDTSPASTAFVQQEIAALGNGSPDSLNTLNELAAALGDDASFSTTVTNSIATKLPLAGGTLTGNLGVGITASSAIGIYHSQSLANGLAAELSNTQSSTGSGLVVKGGNNSSTYSADFRDYNNNSLMRVRGDGNVGIGTTSPQAPLHARNGSSGVSSYTAGTRAIIEGTATTYLTLASPTTSNKGILFADSDDSDAGYITYDPTDNLDFGTAGSTRLRIDSSGNVGIATNSPACPLDVRGITNIRADGGNEQFVIKRDSSPNEQMILGVHSSDYSTIQAIEQGVAYRTLALNPLGGTVGIGTTSPSSTLTVNGTIESLKDDTYGTNEGGQLVLRSPSASTTKKRYNIDTFNVSGSSVLRIFSEDDSNGANGAVHMAIHSDSKVGIGTTSPDNALHIVSTNSGVLKMARSSNVFGFEATTTSGGGYGLYDYGAGDYDIWFNSSGVGIGTESPTKLGLTGSSAGKVLHLGGDDCQLRLEHTILHHDHSANTTTHLRNHYGATDSLARIKYEAGYHSWHTTTSFDEKMRLQNSTLYVTTDLGAHTNVTSFAHSTYAHAAVFGCNSTPDGTVVIEDYDVSSGIGNTVLKLYLRDQDPATHAVFIDFSDGGGRVGSVTHNDDGGGVTYNTSSDYRLKENVNYTWDALSLLTQLKPAKFNFIGKTDKTRQGFLAHEVMDIVPGSVRGTKDQMEPVGTITDNDGNVVNEGVYEHFCKTDEGQTWTQTGTEPYYQQLDYARLVPLLTKAIQEQQTIIDDSKSRLDEAGL